MSEKPPVVVFAAVKGKGVPRQEQQFRELGLDVEMREYPPMGKEPAISKFKAVVCVIDFVRGAMWVGPKEAARKAGVPFFAVTKRSVDPTWKPLKEWAATSVSENGTTFTGGRLSDPPEEVTEIDARSAYPVESEEEERERHRREVQSWKKVAEEHEASEKKAEKARDEALARVLRLEAIVGEKNEEIERTKRIKDQYAKEVKDLQKKFEESLAHSAQNKLRLERDELAARVRELTTLLGGWDGKKEAAIGEWYHLKDSSVAKYEGEIRELKKKLEQKDEARDQPAGEIMRAEKIDEMAKKLWSLVVEEVLDAEEAFEKLVRYAKGGK